MGHGSPGALTFAVVDGSPQTEEMESTHQTPVREYKSRQKKCIRLVCQGRKYQGNNDKSQLEAHMGAGALMALKSLTHRVWVPLRPCQAQPSGLENLTVDSIAQKGKATEDQSLLHGTVKKTRWVHKKSLEGNCPYPPAVKGERRGVNWGPKKTMVCKPDRA